VKKLNKELTHNSILDIKSEKDIDLDEYKKIIDQIPEQAGYDEVINGKEQRISFKRIMLGIYSNERKRSHNPIFF
jgi:hypothetical protein